MKKIFALLLLINFTSVFAKAAEPMYPSVFPHENNEISAAGYYKYESLSNLIDQSNIKFCHSTKSYLNYGYKLNDLKYYMKWPGNYKITISYYFGNRTMINFFKLGDSQYTHGVYTTTMYQLSVILDGENESTKTIKYKLSNNKYTKVIAASYTIFNENGNSFPNVFVCLPNN